MTLAEIETLAIVSEHLSSSGCGFVEISSLSEPGLVHRVYVNNKLYAVSCDCRGAKGSQFDCGHKVRTDRALDSRREQRAKDAERTALLNYELGIGA